MGDPIKDKNDANGSGGGTPPAPTKTIEERFTEMEENQKKLQSTLQTTQEELKRVNGLNSVLMQQMKRGNPPAPDNSGEGMDVNRTVPIKLRRNFSEMDPASDPAGFAREIVAETAEQVRSTMLEMQSQQDSSAKLRTAFYTKNKDLVGYEIEVGHFSNQVQAEMPNVPFDQAAEEIAKRTREYLKSKGLPDNPAGGGTPPGVLPPAGAGGGDGKIPIKAPGGGEEPFNADKSYEEDMKDYSKMRNSERSRNPQGQAK